MPPPPPPPRAGWRMPWSKTAQTMDAEQSARWLSQFIGKQLRIHASDGRVFAGHMKCTDKDRNIILALAHEYRAPSPDVIRKTVEQSVTWNSRYVGLVVVPGHHITKIEFEESTLPGQKSGLTL